MDGDTMYEQYLRDCDELEKCSELKSNLKALVEEIEREEDTFRKNDYPIVASALWKVRKKIEQLLEGE